MSESESPIARGTRVRTTRDAQQSLWTQEAQHHRRWGVTGSVIGCHDSHGLCYDVLHDEGDWGSYDPSELEIIS